MKNSKFIYVRDMDTNQTYSQHILKTYTPNCFSKKKESPCNNYITRAYLFA